MKLKFGMIGGAGGGIGPVHMRGTLLDHKCELTAGCFSRHEEKNRAQAEEWGIRDLTRLYPDYRAMAAEEGARTGDDRLDFVVIVTPNDTHYEIAKAFMEQNIHIVCDKPLAFTVEEGEELARIAKERNLLFGVTYTYSGYAMIRQARELIEHGELGEITYINAEYPQEWLALALVQENSANAMWRLDPARAGESQATADIGTHIEYLVKAATGLSPERVLARFDHIPRDLKMESNTTILCQYPNNVTGLLWASQIAIGHECDIKLRVFGTKGAIEWQHQDAGRLKFTRLGGPVQYYSAASPYNYEESIRLSRTNPGHPEGLFEAFGNIYRSFCEVLLARKQGREPESFTFPTVEDGVRGLKFVHACVESDRRDSVWMPVE
ncbi:Gfo/Idh/MocA family oxidoreductase [Butyricicoccus faecihominis]|uniref:Gfo/Idh/MocA family protein n=1 Tax=Butyricicoccus faecihominis TaxID=1712515 RepID=UPI00247AC659|nr:Gfo/Idh/MocA family oxidoreductase [Butyricicoccus faecihominis]MCQ5128463.1 Gfo/Idh/MocA family oxidoreductase [Butyricicoccus faecihominis]